MNRGWTRAGLQNLAHARRPAHGRGMRQRCELCEAIGCLDSARGNKLIGIWVGTRDALMCPDHALFALDSDVESMDELVEVYEFVNQVDAAPAASRKRSRGGGAEVLLAASD